MSNGENADILESFRIAGVKDRNTPSLYCNQEPARAGRHVKLTREYYQFLVGEGNTMDLVHQTGQRPELRLPREVRTSESQQLPVAKSPTES